MIEPVEIIEESVSKLTVIWSDHRETTYTAVDLRRKCPCAGCVNEWTGQRTLKPESVAEDVVFTTTSIVGRYALNFHFSDGHDTGIFSFQYLREIASD